MKIATKLVMVVIAVMFVLNISACGRRYAKGGYIDPNTVILRSDKFVESDLQIIADKLASSLASDPVAMRATTPPIVMVSLMTNATDEHIDVDSLTNKIRVALHKTGKFRFINVKARDTLKDEYDYESEFMDAATAKKKGKQLGADYIITGYISSIKQPVGRQKIVYYKATLELTDVTNNIMSWTDEVEIKKKFRKRYTGY